MAASTTAVAPSYSEALETSRPVSRHIIVCHSRIVRRVPWLASGWYGV